MKKIIILGLSILLMMASFTGCQSTLKPAMDMKRYREEIREIDFSTMFSEETGYVFADASWSLSPEEFQDQYYSAITALYAEYGDGSITYQADYFIYYFSSRKNSEALITFAADGKLSDISLIYNSDDATSTNSQSAMYEKLIAAAKEAFGEPAKEIDDKMTTSDNQTASEKGYSWEYACADGTVTSVEIGEIFSTFTSEPDYVTLSFTRKVSEE